MIEGLLILVGGLLGSSHCVGMCGGLVLTLGSVRPGLVANLCRQLVYALGRVCTYAAGGAAAGYGGWRLVTELRPVVNAQALLSIAAGVLLVIQGLLAAGVLRLPRVLSGGGACPGAGSFAALLQAPRLRHVFAAGILNGLLPCGLVYAYLALAASSGDLLRGSVVMALFGLGTVPVMVLTGSVGSLLSLGRRRRLFRVAAWCMVLTGVLAIARGAGFIQLSGITGEPTCPLCGEPPG